MRARKALAEDKVGEGGLFAFKKLVQVTRRHPLPLRDCGNGQIAVAEIFCYVRHDRAQPSGTDAAPLRDRVTVSCGASSQSDEIVNVGCDKSLELGRVQRLLFSAIARAYVTSSLIASEPAGTMRIKVSSMLRASGAIASRSTRKPRKLTDAGWSKLRLIESRVINIASPSSRANSRSRDRAMVRPLRLTATKRSSSLLETDPLDRIA